MGVKVVFVEDIPDLACYVRSQRVVLVRTDLTPQEWADLARHELPALVGADPAQ